MFISCTSTQVHSSGEDRRGLKKILSWKTWQIWWSNHDLEFSYFGHFFSHHRESSFKILPASWQSIEEEFFPIEKWRCYSVFELGLTISRSIFISREREFPKHFGYFPGISRELKTYLIANRKYPIFERKCIFWGSRIILSFVTIIFDSKVWFWAQRKISKIEWNRKICQSQYIKISRNFPGNRKNSRDQAGLKIFGKFPGIPAREFPGTSPIRNEHSYRKASSYLKFLGHFGPFTSVGFATHLVQWFPWTCDAVMTSNSKNAVRQWN